MPDLYFDETNVFTLLKSANDILRSRGIENPEPDSRLLLSFALNIKRSSLNLIRDHGADKDKINLFKQYIFRRAQREPCAYITGLCGFMEFEFKVNGSVLIPRPETELMVEEVLKTARLNKSKSVLDLCTGSGCIAVSLSKMGNFEDIKAVDISSDALNIASENAVINKAVNIEFILSDMFEGVNGKKFDIIVSNPPYVGEGEYESLQPELRYEPKIALTAPDSGLYFYNKIASDAQNFLNDNGFIFLELNANMSKEIFTIFNERGYKNIEIFYDYSRLPRILKAGI